LRLLAAGNVEGMTQTGVRLGSWWLHVRRAYLLALGQKRCCRRDRSRSALLRLPDQELTLQPIEVCLAVTLPSAVHCRERLGQHVQPLFDLACSPICLSQLNEERRAREL